MSVCFWESGDISRLNDDAVIGLYDLIVERDVTERDVIGPCNLVTERAPIPLLFTYKFETEISHINKKIVPERRTIFL
ncbi:MAG: hypothetical protein J6J29_03590 [Paludibacteraceae bacterium]|nr:hypothetical protein [Paludibacteraceae bacterium]